LVAFLAHASTEPAAALLARAKAELAYEPALIAFVLAVLAAEKAPFA